MNDASTYIAVVWACCCIGIALVAVPALAFGIATRTESRTTLAGRAFVSTWALVAVLVPAFAAIRGFNWATALLICGLAPTALWLVRHGSGSRLAFNRAVRAFVLRAVTARTGTPPVRRLSIAIACMLALVAALFMAAASTGLRLIVPADFDTLWRTRQLLSGSPSSDPLAAVAAIAARIAAVEPIVAIIAVRICLIAATAVALGVALVERIGRRSVAAAAMMPIAFATPGLSLDVWAIALLAIIAVTGTVRHLKRGDHVAWHALAVVMLASAQLAHIAGPDTLWRQARQTASLEHPAAARETLRLAQQAPSGDWMLVGPPEQALEVEGRGHFYDLLQFVSRFRDRTGRPDFRFDVGATRLYVIVEKEPLNVGHPVVGVRFIDTQPAAYRVQSERDRLERAARRLCDDYRRTHSGTAIAYDDVALRIYQFEL